MTAEYWDERYRQPGFIFGHQPNTFLKEVEVLFRRNARILCLGDGEGRNGMWLVQQGHRVTTVDLSEVAVSKAITRAKMRGLELDAHVGDLDTWLDHDDAQGPWDVVVAIFCPLPAALRAKVAQQLTPRMTMRGLLVLEAHTPTMAEVEVNGPVDPQLILRRENIVADWPDWRLDIKLVKRRIFEGTEHRGLASVIQVLGQPPMLVNQ